ncbi:MAG: DUF3380 domain-containing protein, partial [Gammaproteobacteria bacterium]|nr:DUF3380 domain-containing protein [Gammaproteobacteria bacterium]
TRRGFDSDGRMLIRFENQIFFDKWGQANVGKFNRHFRFDLDRPWQSHQWRPTPDATWREVHEDHNSEWQAFTLAQSLDDTAAKLAIAMGAPQIMGFNYPVIGHLSVDQMFADFSTSEQHQIIGFFDLIGGLTADSRQLDALRRQDFDSFAALQYGGQQAARQANNLRRLLAAFQALQEK